MNFRFDPAEEADAEKKGLELFSKSPYKGQLANVELFLEALEARSAQLPNLLHGRFSNDFGSSHLIGMQALAGVAKHLQMNRLDQMAALPLGSRIAARSLVRQDCDGQAPTGASEVGLGEDAARGVSVLSLSQATGRTRKSSGSNPAVSRSS